MAEHATIFDFFKKPESESDRERRELLTALAETRDELRRARARFNSVSEPELVEASVYEINAAQARYSYLLRKLREDTGKRRKEA